MKRLLTIVSVLFLLTTVACDDDADDAAPDDDPEAAAEDDYDDGDEVDETAKDDDGHTDGDHELADDLEPGESGHYGEPFTIDDDPVPLGEAIAGLYDSRKQPDKVKVSSRVQHACEKRGCWMALDADGIDIPVRVHMHDYSFFVPRNAAGADAIVEGSIEHTVISEDDARHYAEHVVDQTGVDPEDIEGEQEMYEFTATGIALELPES